MTSSVDNTVDGKQRPANSTSAEAMRQERKKANDRFGDALYYVDGQTIRRKDRQQLTTAYKQP